MTKFISYANFILTLGLVATCLIGGGIPIRLSTNQRLLLAPVNCEHGISMVAGRIVEKGQPCHTVLKLPQPEQQD